MSGSYHLPSQIIIPTSTYRDGATPLVPESFLPKGKHYLSDDYNLRLLQPYFAHLRVKNITPSDFRSGLLNMGDHIQAQTDHWHELVCLQLHHQKAKHLTGNVSISDLKIIPLQGGTWGSVGSADAIIFHLDNRSIPSGLPLRTVRTDIPTSSARYRFFAAIGVKETTPSHIAREILKSSAISLRSLIEYAKFLFTYRHSSAMPSPSTLLVVDQSGARMQGSELYFDHPLSGLGNKTLRDILPAGTIPFIHLDYLSAYKSNDRRTEWYSWLRSSLGLNTAPRVLDGRLSPEFRKILTTLSAIRILIVLSEFWTQISKKLSDASRRELSEIEIVCENGARRALKDTCLKTRDLKHYDVSGLCFLPIDNPDQDCWHFLRELGVTIRADAVFYLNLLRRMSKEDSRDDNTIQEIYIQLNARFQEDSSAIM